MNGISQDLFICVNTVLSKSTFLFKLLALVPLIKLDHFTVKDAIFFDNQQIGRNHLSECIRLDITFNCFKSAYCGEWLFKFRYTTQRYNHHFFSLQLLVGDQYLAYHLQAANHCAWEAFFHLAPRVSFLARPRFRERKEERPWERGWTFSVVSCSPWREWKHLQTSCWKSVSLEEIFRGLRSTKKIPSSLKLEPWKDLFWSVIVELTLGVFYDEIFGSRTK